MYKLRPPQQIVFNKIKNELKNGNKRILISAPTGFGKTILSYQIFKDAIAKNNRVLFTSHRIQLAEQSRDKFIDLNLSFLQGNSEGFKEDYSLLVATLQTLINVQINPPKIVIIDEVHYAYESNLIQSLFLKFPDAIFLGLSATPVDNKNFLLDGFDTIIDDYQTEDLIKLGWLVPFKVFSPMAIDTKNIKISSTTNDYQEKSLLDEVLKPDINSSIVDNYLKLGDNKKFISFALNKKHCEVLKLTFISKGINTEIISADTSKADRIKIFKNFANGTTKGLISIEILTAGFDDPTVQCIILASPTKSWKKYIQSAGRGIRLLGQTIEESIKNGKEYCILLDCAGCVQEHDMPDKRKNLFFNKKISRVLDKQLNLDTSNENRKKISETISEEKQIFLKRIGSVLDLYENKIYTKESDLQDDVNNFLNKTGYFYWRQNSGKMFKDDRWIHFS